MEITIKNCKITEKLFRKDRWFVKIDPDYMEAKTMPLAQYNWLLGNPAFKEIPKEYVIHHLDGDAQNDDISNLVLMQKHHHAAYHWKQKTVNPKVTFDRRYWHNGRHTQFHFQPDREPAIRYDKKAKKHYLYFRETLGGESKRRYVSVLNGRKLKTREDAEWAKAQIWPQTGDSLTS